MQLPCKRKGQFKPREKSQRSYSETDNENLLAFPDSRPTAIEKAKEKEGKEIEVFKKMVIGF